MRHRANNSTQIGSTLLLIYGFSTSNLRNINTRSKLKYHSIQQLPSNGGFLECLTLGILTIVCVFGTTKISFSLSDLLLIMGLPMINCSYGFLCIESIGKIHSACVVTLSHVHSPTHSNFQEGNNFLMMNFRNFGLLVTHIATKQFFVEIISRMGTE